MNSEPAQLLRAAISPSRASESGCAPAASLPAARSQTWHTRLFVNTEPANISTASVGEQRAAGRRERQPVPCVCRKRRKKEAPPKPPILSLAEQSSAASGKFKPELKASVLCCFFFLLKRWLLSWTEVLMIFQTWLSLLGHVSDGYRSI